MVKFLKVRILQRTPPEPPLGRASRGERSQPAMRDPPRGRRDVCRRRVRPPRTPARLDVATVDAPDRAHRQTGVSRRLGLRASPTQVATPRRLDARARSTRSRAEPRWATFFPVASAGSSASAMTATRSTPNDARVGALDGLRVRPAARASTAGAPRRPVAARASVFFLGFFSRRSCAPEDSQKPSAPLSARRAVADPPTSAPLTSANPFVSSHASTRSTPLPLRSCRPTKSSWSCRAATPARRL